MISDHILFYGLPASEEWLRLCNEVGLFRGCTASTRSPLDSHGGHGSRYCAMNKLTLRPGWASASKSSTD